MKTLPRPNIPVVQQIEYINLAKVDFYSPTKLCFYMDCPTDISNSIINCNECIGGLRMDYLKEIQPGLDSSNMVQTLLTWNLLLK